MLNVTNDKNGGVETFLILFIFVHLCYVLPSPRTVFPQAFEVNSLRWRIRGEWAGNALASLLAPRDPKRIGRSE